MAISLRQNAYGAMQDGYNFGHDAQRQRQVENAYASGDEEAVARQGDIRGAEAMAGRRDAQEGRARLGGVRRAVASGDYAGATEAAGGDPELRKSVDDDRARAAQKAMDDATFAWDTTSKLALIPPEQRGQALARITPVLQQRFPGEDFANIDLSDAGLKERLQSYDLIREHVKEQFMNLGGGQGVVGLNPSTGASRVVVQGQHPAPAGYAWGEDGELAFVPGGPADPRAAKPLADAKRAPPRAAALRSGGGKISNLNIGLPDIEGELRRRGVIQ